ncbi:hypothetical protein K438DRAFT_623429 [Mycena galopus ATCC 62051]|nr:hypothetical protein K438DRAFT_623429 [Mycena galopus ATCC 62051]
MVDPREFGLIIIAVLLLYSSPPCLIAVLCACSRHSCILNLAVSCCSLYRAVVGILSFVMEMKRIVFEQLPSA